MGDCTGRFAQGALDDGMHLACGTGGMPGEGLVAQQTLNAFLGEALLPAPHHRPADADPLGNLQHRQALGGQQDDLRRPNVLTGRPLSSMTPGRSARRPAERRSETVRVIPADSHGSRDREFSVRVSALGCVQGY